MDALIPLFIGLAVFALFALGMGGGGDDDGAGGC